MKKIIAKICIWILGKLGYEKNYNLKHTIHITADTTEAVKSLNKLREANIKLIEELKLTNGLHTK